MIEPVPLAAPPRKAPLIAMERLRVSPLALRPALRPHNQEPVGLHRAVRPVSPGTALRDQRSAFGVAYVTSEHCSCLRLDAGRPVDLIGLTGSHTRTTANP